MLATLQHRIVGLQPGLIVMAIIPSDLNLLRTPTIDEDGYLIDQRVSTFTNSFLRQSLRKIHLMYVLRRIGVRWIFPHQNVTSLLSEGEIPDSYRYIQEFRRIVEQQGLSYVIVLLPRMEQNAWGHLAEQMSKDAIRCLDLSVPSEECTVKRFRASRHDNHPSPAVHRRIGESLADYIGKQMRHIS